MKIGIVGGTGREGRGLAVRWAKAGHDVFIGSRQTEKGVAKAAEFANEFGVSLQGADNVAACEHGDLIVVTVPYSAHRATFESIKKFHILPGEFTIEGGELTPTLKIKRDDLEARYRPIVEKDRSKPVTWESEL